MAANADGQCNVNSSLTRIVIADCRLQQTLGVLRVKRYEYFDTRNVSIPRCVVLGVLSRYTSSSAVWTAKHDRHFELTSAQKCESILLLYYNEIYSDHQMLFQM